MTRSAAIRCGQCGVAAILDDHTAVMTAEFTTFASAHSTHQDVTVRVHLAMFSPPLEVILMIAATGVYQWIGDVLIDHEGLEMCELILCPRAPVAHPAWQLTRPNGAIEIHNSVTAAHAAVTRLVQQAHPR